MRLSIERMRTLVLAAAGLLVVALVAFLVIGRWKNPFNRHDLPKRLGLNIQQEANGWTYTHEVSGHTLFKIHASRLVQMKKGNHVLLHEVRIELYGADGMSLDSIAGNEFEYDPEGGIAKANGPVEITLTRPEVAPAIAPKATPGQALGDKAGTTPLTEVARKAARGEIHVETSGLVFDRNSGVASTSRQVQFSLAEGSGSAAGALYDSNAGKLVLDGAVRLKLRRGTEPAELEAEHAEFVRGDRECRLRTATASYQGGQAKAEEATIEFREDGSAERIDARSGFKLTTATGGSLAAPTGTLLFDARNQPTLGHLEGGVTIDTDERGKKVHGTAPTMEIAFTGDGVLHHAHLERGVRITSDERSLSHGEVLRTQRTWKSPLADIDFRSAGNGKVELATINGLGGVVVTGESRRGNGPATASRMTADEVTGTFGANSALTAMTGVGHAMIEQTTPAGTRQTTSGDRLVAHFESGQTGGAAAGSTGEGRGVSMQIQSATVEGHVVLVQEPQPHPGTPAQAPMRATAARAVYEGVGEWLHLTGSPRVEDGALQLSANRIDVSQESGDAQAHGNVKATWLGAEAGKSAAGQGTLSLGSGQGPAHVVADEAQLNQEAGEAVFRGRARLWQQANSITAPVIVLDRKKETLVARTTSAAQPVRVVLVSAASLVPQKPGKMAVPSVVRLRGGDLKYSAAERKAVIRGGVAGSVVAQTEEATTVANEVDLILLPPGNHAGKDGEAAQVDRMTARGRVSVTSEGRRGTGEKLVYSGDTGEFVMTGTAASPPRLTDPARGTVTGDSLIFNSRDDSVRIEGGARETTTETTAPR